MSAGHGETVIQKPISEYAKYLKSLIPANIPEAFSLRPMFERVAGEEEIRKGVIAFRDFLYILCDRLISGGYSHARPQKTSNPTDYPFLHNINHLLIDVGYHGRQAESGESLLLTEVPSFSVPRPKIPGSKQMECLRFLSLCGLRFMGIDLEAKTFHMQGEYLEVKYPDDPVMLTGLKALSIADMELRPRRYSNDDHLLWCDYGLMETDVDILGVLKNYLHPLSKDVREFAVGLYRRYMDMGMTYTVSRANGLRIACSNVKNIQKALSSREIYDRRVWEFAVSMRDGCCLVVRTKKTDRYAGAIEKFSPYLQGKIAREYGCDRKLRGERCQHGCQGILIPLDDGILSIGRDIETWLDHEI